MAVILEILTDHTPRYISTREVAFQRHYDEGGFLWKRMEGQPEVYKPWMTGIPPVSRLAIYELFMVDGRKPTADDIKAAEKACYDARDNDLALM